MCPPNVEGNESEASSSVQPRDLVINAFLDNMSMFKIYEAYIKNFNHAKSILMSLEKNELNFFFTEVYSNSECKGHSFEVFIVLFYFYRV